MGIFKWLCKKFSCISSCKYNIEMENCPKKSMENLDNILNRYELSIKDVMDINKILSKAKNKVKNIVETIQQSTIL
jgi:tRNA C32,U32 (ribose-2'-O)-methylase TrmJ